ncbi:DUF771 domain-containing protein [Sporosarcina psychrophila]|uniref:Phage pi2 protein 07 n=1 Tax=Sporosarcina psychrophila TaxID=1476 RepID=A0ABV2KF00_SPOPS
MMQQLEVNLIIPIPNDSVLITKIELEEFQRQQIVGVYWNMKDLEQRTGRKIDWLKVKLLFPVHFRKTLDVDNGGFVYYPKSKGQAWAFHASKMANFLDKNFHRIFKE